MGRKGKKSSNFSWKKVLIGFIISVLVLGTWVIFEDNKTTSVYEMPTPTQYFFVEDYSGVLNEKTERFIYDEAVKLYEETSAQVVVVTVPDTQDASLEGFANKLANEWGIGDREKDNGVLLLFETDPDEPHVRLEVGKGLEGILPDGKAGRILDDYAVEPKNDGAWNKAAADTFIAICKEVCSEYGLSYDKTPGSEGWEDPDAPTTGTFGDAAFPEVKIIENDAPFLEQLGEAIVELLVIIGFFLFIFLILVVLWFFGGSGSGGGGSYSGRSSGGGGGFSGGGGSFGGGGASR